jgi:predicted Zn-dependent peptidase
MNTTRMAALISVFALSACRGQKVAHPVSSAQGPDTQQKAPGLDAVRESPPESGPARETPFPKVERTELPNGLQLQVIQAHTLPLVQLRIVVKTGSAADGDLTGLAALAARMLKDGGAGRYSSKDLLGKVETLGGDLGVEVDADSTVLSLAVAREHFEEAVDLLALVAREPRWDGSEFTKLKKRQVQRVTDRAKSSGAWTATMLLFRELYRLPAGVHPYASYDALPSEFQKITVANCRDFYRKHFVPKNATVIVAGDVSLDAARTSVERALAGWKGPDVEPLVFAEATPPEHLKILLANRPKSAQTDIYVGMLGPSRRDETWIPVKVANQVLGGGVSGRLFLDVREKRSLAYHTRSAVGELARGPVPLTAYAGTQTAKTGLAVQALLDNLKRISQEPAANDEMNTARRYLADIFAIKMETIGSVADMVVSLNVLGLPDDYYDEYRKQIREVSADVARKAAAEYIRNGHAVIAVAGDADRIGPVLSHFGEVVVYDPEKEFERVRTIPANPSAPIELERESGQ